MTDVETVIAARDIAVAAVTTTAANVDLATQQADRAEVARDAAVAPTAAQLATVDADAGSAFRTQQDARLSATFARTRGIDVRNFVQTGEALTTDGSAVGDNTTIFQRALTALGALSKGMPLYVPAGDYLLRGLTASGHTGIVGDGIDKTNLIKDPTAPGGTLMFQGGTGTSRVRAFRLSDITLDGNGSTTGQGVVLAEYNAYDGAAFERVRFVGHKGGAGASVSAVGPVQFTDCIFDGRGLNIGTGVSVGDGAEGVRILRCDFRYLRVGVTAGTTGSTNKVRGLFLKESRFDGGWWTSIASDSGSGGTVTYTATTVTDTSKSFSGLVAGQTIRVMAVKRSGTATSQPDAGTLTDTAADFVTAGVARGDIVRVSGKMAVVRSVRSATSLAIEPWLSETDRSFVTAPANGIAYTVHGTIVGAVASSTATTITVGLWRDLNGTSVTPTAGTLYEILPGGLSYQVVAANNCENVRYIDNTVRRSWGDSLVAQCGDVTMQGNVIEDGQDNCMVVGSATVATKGHLVIGNRGFHNGTNGLTTVGVCNDMRVLDNIWIDNGWGGTGTTTPTNCATGVLFDSTGARAVISGNVTRNDTVTRDVRAYVVRTAMSDITFDRNTSVGHATKAVDIRSGVTGVKFGPGQSAAFPEGILDAGTGTTYQDVLTATAPQVDLITATGAGTWTKPSGAVRHRVIAVAAGGGGGSGRRGAAASVRCGGGGGAGGQVVFGDFLASELGATEAYSVGGGGAGGGAIATDDTSGATGTAGGNTYFGTSGNRWLSALGGNGGSGGTTTNGPGGGAVTPGSGAGASASTTGAVGTSAGATSRPSPVGGAGAASGGGITSADATSAGGAGAAPYSGDQNAPTAGAADGGAAAGAGKVSRSSAAPGGSGAGGGSSKTTAAGAGGAGGKGSGGGGGGASLNGFASGAGGVGGDGFLVVITYFA